MSSPKRNSDMEAFWAGLPSKVKSALWFEGRRLVLSSDDLPLSLVLHSRLSISTLKTQPKYYLFTDAFVIVQGATVTEFPLELVWVEHHVPTDTIQQMQHLASFHLLLPETTLELQCKELIHKSRWVTAIADYIGAVLSLPQFLPGRGDLNLDTKLELLRSREHLEYTFRTLPEVKDGRYKGQWKNGKPSGSGEFIQQSTGIQYRGDFRDGKFHGQGEIHWFSDKDQCKKYIGEFRQGTMEGHGEMKYSNGDIYSGQWSNGLRSGFGKIEESSKNSSFYIGGWRGDKRNGYGIYEDKVKHDRYLGTWVDDVKCGPGIIITSTDTYCEAVFANGAISPGNDGFIIGPNGRSFTGKLGPDMKLAGKGLLTLTDGTRIEGIFNGNWNKKIEIVKGTLESWGKSVSDDDDAVDSVYSQLQIATLDKRIGNCTVMACNKWQEIFRECEKSLGVSGDAANDVFSAWNKLASNAFQKRTVCRSKSSPITQPRKSSFQGLHSGMSVKVPVQLIPLERARSQTTTSLSHDNEFLASIKCALEKRQAGESVSGSFPTSARAETREEFRPEISHPVNLEESTFSSSYSSGHSYKTNSPPYAPQADFCDIGSPDQQGRLVPVKEEVEEEERRRRSEIEAAVGPMDVRVGIQRYVDKAFGTPDHPLGMLMDRIEMVYRLSYGGLEASKYLLPHAIAETHSTIQRIHGIVRILFPFLSNEDKNLSCYGYSRTEEAKDSGDPDDYVSIDSGYSLLHSLVFTRLFPTLIHLYVLHHETQDSVYQKGLYLLKDMDDDKLVHYIKFPDNICAKLVGKSAEGDILKCLDLASNTLRVITSLFTPGEFLEHFKTAFRQLSSIDQLCGDFLLPAIIYILVKANIPHLGAYLHFLMDFAHTQPEDEYTLVTYEASYNFIKGNSESVPGSL